MRYGREISAAVDPLDLGWPAVAVRAGVGLVYSVLIEEVVTPRSVGGRTGATPIKPFKNLRNFKYIFLMLGRLF